MECREKNRMLNSVKQSSASTAAADEIGSNEDLVTAILLRLPVKSLLRFESISKKWLSLISNPHFAQNYSRRHNPIPVPSGILLNHDYAGFQFDPFNDDGDQANKVVVRPLSPNDPGIMIYQSCNGLLLCSSTIYSVSIADEYIFNPTTKHLTAIRFPTPEFRASVIAVNLAFDPLKSPHYKLLSIREVDKETLACRIDIYSSETGSWRPPLSGDPLIFTAQTDIALRGPVYCWGAIHWTSSEETSLYFDMDTESLKTMPMPPFREGFNYHYDVQYYGESRGHLHLIMIHGDQPSRTEFDIWELETNYSRWFVRYRVNLDAVMTAYPAATQNGGDDEHANNAFSVLCVARAEKEEESSLVLFVSGKAISFKLKNMTSKTICDLMPCRKMKVLDYEWFDAYQYIESFFHV